MHGADGLHTTGSTRAPQPQHTKEAQDTVASRAPQRLIRSTRTSRRAQSHRVPLGRSTQTSRKLHAHAPAPCASRGTTPRARCRAALQCTSRGTAREPGVRIARHRPGVVCRAAVHVARHRPASPACASRGTGPASCAALGPAHSGATVPGAPECARRGARACCRARRVPGVRHSEQQRQSAAGPCLHPNRMETGARYEYRILISRISQPTFAKMARSPNFMAQCRRTPGGDGHEIWQSA